MKKKSLLSCFSHIMNNYHDFEEQQVSVCLEIAVPSPAWVADWMQPSLLRLHSPEAALYADARV